LQDHIYSPKEGNVAIAEINSGICGFKTTVKTQMKGERCTIDIQSDCEAVRKLGAHLKETEPFREITFKGEGPLSLELGASYCAHTACPVPVGIIKAIEVESGLALPADVTIRISKSEEI